MNDPVKLEQNKRDAEKRMVPGGTREPDVPLGRDCLPPTMWAEKLEATPYGRADKMFSAAPRSQAQVEQQSSSVAFDHFAFERTRAIIDAEFPKPKRTYPSRR